MSCSHCIGAEKIFDSKSARKDLESYRKKGPSKTTRILIDAIQQSGIEGTTLLDIGGGVGIIRHELLKAGLSAATSVEGSSASIEESIQEGMRQGHHDASGYFHGDFVELANTIPPAGIVTLDKVICCYPGMQQLVSLSAQRAEKLYGVIYPMDSWWMKIGFMLFNLVRKWKNNPFQIYIHPVDEIESLILKSGLKLSFIKKSTPWIIAVYHR